MHLLKMTEAGQLTLKDAFGVLFCFFQLFFAPVALQYRGEREGLCGKGEAPEGLQKLYG